MTAPENSNSPRNENSPLRILHVCSIKGRGGTGYMASRCCRFLHELGHAVWVGACADSKVEERARENGLLLLEGLKLRRGFHPLDLWHDVRIIRHAIRENNIDVVHTWHSIEYWTCALAVLGTTARLARTRGLMTPIPAHFFNRLIHKHTAAIFVTCKKIETLYRDAGFSLENVFLLKDGVDVERYRPGGAREKVREELGLSNDTPLLVNVGRLARVKGQTYFLQALARLQDGVHGMIAGDGDCREELEQEARDLGIAERVHFLGVRNDVEHVLAAADIYVLCSIGSEGSSRATLEAMACGLPVVTTTVGMLPDIVKAGRTGLLAPPTGVGELVECLENLLLDATMSRNFGQAACELVQREHTEKTMAENLVTVYRK